jgi:hypothetical protein
MRRLERIWNLLWRLWVRCGGDADLGRDFIVVGLGGGTGNLSLEFERGVAGFGFGGLDLDGRGGMVVAIRGSWSGSRSIWGGWWLI